MLHVIITLFNITSIMDGRDLLKFHQVNTRFDFMLNSSYKLYCSRATVENCLNEQACSQLNSVKTCLTPAFIKLSDSKNAFYNSIYSIKHLYEQNKQKIERTCSKLKEELKHTDVLLENYSKVFVGTWSILYIEYVMNKFLGFSLTYEKYLNKVACFSDRYSTYTDVLSYYLSLTNVYEKLTNEYYYLLNTLHIFGSKASHKASEISSHILGILSTLESYEDQLNLLALESHRIKECILKLQSSGYQFSFKMVKTKYYVDSILLDLSKNGSGKLVKPNNLHIQINIIRNKIILLKLLTKKLNV